MFDKKATYIRGYLLAKKTIERDGKTLAVAKHHRGVACSDLDQNEFTKGWKDACDEIIREAVMANVNEIQVCVDKQMHDEIERLKAALKGARKAAKHHGIGSREFASMCGISAKQLSDWTEDKITTQPDFVD